MRTTLTLDDDLAQILKRRAAKFDLPFKEVVNATLRRGLEISGQSTEKPSVKTLPFSSGLKPGIDAEKMNQLVDQLEVDEIAAKLVKEGASK